MGTNRAPRRTPERGQYGNTRGKERQRRRTERRMQDPRVKAAADATAKAQEALDRQMEEEAANPAIGAALGAQLKQDLEAARQREDTLRLENETLVEEHAPKPAPAPPKPRTKPAPVKKVEGQRYVTLPIYEPFNIDSIPSKAEGDQGWTLGNARQLVIIGYSINRVVEMTGWGKSWFSDIPVDDEGYGLGRDAWYESQD